LRGTHYFYRQDLIILQVVNGLTSFTNLVQALSQHYIKTTNTVLTEAGLVEHVLDARPLYPAAAEADADGKKEKKKRVHDPNAPKRPLTPFFLYMQTARPIIALDLGPDVPKKDVAQEGVRRWKEMADGDKQLWTNAYTDNLKLYNARMHAYKAGNMSAKDMTDEEAAAYADANQIQLDDNHALDAQLASEHLADIPADVPSSPSSKEDSPPPAPKPAATPKAKASRSKKAKETPKAAEAETIIPSSAQKESSPDKKRKRSSKKGEEIAADKEEEKPKASRKKRSKGE